MATGSTENNGIFRVTVECLLSSGIKPHGRRLFSFIDLFPPYFIKLCQNIHPKTRISNFRYSNQKIITFFSNTSAGVLKETGTFDSTCVHLWCFSGVLVAHLLICLCSCFSFVCLCSVSCDRCCPCFWIVYSWLLLRISITFILTKGNTYKMGDHKTKHLLNDAYCLDKRWLIENGHYWRNSRHL